MINLDLEIPEDYLKEEDICGFHVTQRRKELWAVELDLLVQFDEFCKAHGLSYCVGAGTMLGAVRHHGFIPWDDDIDVYMIRKDYNKLTKLAGEFSYPYFLQNSYTEKNLYRRFTRLRNSLTTGTTRREEHRLINRGIFIDVFPIDGVSPDKAANSKQEKLHKKYWRRMGWYNVAQKEKYHLRASDKIKVTIKKMIVKTLIINKDKLTDKFEENLGKYSYDGIELWGNRALSFNCVETCRPLKDYTDTVRMPFEFIEVPVPRNYDEMLRQQYGDYMEYPSNKNGSIHGELKVSTEYAYNDPRSATCQILV